MCARALLCVLQMAPEEVVAFDRVVHERIREGDKISFRRSLNLRKHRCEAPLLAAVHTECTAREFVRGRVPSASSPSPSFDAVHAWGLMWESWVGACA